MLDWSYKSMNVNAMYAETEKTSGLIFIVKE